MPLPQVAEYCNQVLIAEFSSISLIMVHLDLLLSPLNTFMPTNCNRQLTLCNLKVCLEKWSSTLRLASLGQCSLILKPIKTFMLLLLLMLLKVLMLLTALLRTLYKAYQSDLASEMNFQ